jgi:hypothetical protein
MLRIGCVDDGARNYEQVTPTSFRLPSPAEVPTGPTVSKTAPGWDTDVRSVDRLTLPHVVSGGPESPWRRDPWFPC